MCSWLMCTDECQLPCLPYVNIYNCVPPKTQNIVNWSPAMSKIILINGGLCTA